MDVPTANRIYDEIALIVGTCLHEIGERLADDQVEILATDVDRDAGVDAACAIGRLALDTGDLDAVRRALEVQKDRVRSIMTMSAPNDPAFREVNFRHLNEANVRRVLLQLYLAGRTDKLEHVYGRFMEMQKARR